jgi:hypothetical protein
MKIVNEIDGITSLLRTKRNKLLDDFYNLLKSETNKNKEAYVNSLNEILEINKDIVGLENELITSKLKINDEVNRIAKVLKLNVKGIDNINDINKI